MPDTLGTIDSELFVRIGDGPLHPVGTFTLGVQYGGQDARVATDLAGELAVALRRAADALEKEAARGQ
jgi:hypothetical protein